VLLSISRSDSTASTSDTLDSSPPVTAACKTSVVEVSDESAPFIGGGVSMATAVGHWLSGSRPAADVSKPWLPARRMEGPMHRMPPGIRLFQPPPRVFSGQSGREVTTGYASAGPFPSKIITAGVARTAPRSTSLGRAASLPAAVGHGHDLAVDTRVVLSRQESLASAGRHPAISFAHRAPVLQTPEDSTAQGVSDWRVLPQGLAALHGLR